MHALTGTVTHGALRMVVLEEPLQYVLCVPSMLALLAPNEPHLDVSSHLAAHMRTLHANLLID